MMPFWVWLVVACFAPLPAARAVDPAPASLDAEIVNMIGQIDVNRTATDIQALVGFGTRNTCSNNGSGVAGIGGARDWIRTELAALPGLQVVLDPWTCTSCGDTRTVHNVVGWIPGSGHPNRLIVIGGHYDSRNSNATDPIGAAPGANDSGSQTALVLEAARVMAGHSFDATVVFAAWSGEEQGSFASKAFVQHFRNYFPTGTLEMNFNADIVGGDNTVNNSTNLQQFRLFSPGTPRELSPAAVGSTDDTSPSRGFMRSIGYWGGAYVPSMVMLPQLREDRPGRQSDQRSFIAKGIPAIRFIDVNENPKHQHTANDLYAYVTPSFTARITQVVVASAATLARAPTPPRNFVASGVTSSSIKVTWALPASGAPVDHYVISARPYSQNFYRTRFLTPAGSTSATVQITQDLGIPSGTPYYVSVAAVDATGNESLYAYPEYRCDETNVCSAPRDALNVTATK